MRAQDSRLTVFLLAICQALAMSATALMLTSSALVGKMLAPDGGLATLPLGLQFVATMVSAAPVAFWMRRAGRRVGFMTGAVFAIAGGFSSALAIFTGSFVLFCLASAIFGAAMASAQHYRFAAAEAASEAFRPKAISLVLGGGVAAAIIGPNLANLGETLFAPYTFAGGFIFLGGLGVLNILILLPIHLTAPTREEDQTPQRPLREIISQPMFQAALAAAMLGYGVMSFLMTATPLAMQSCGFDFGQTAFVLQLHVLGMYLPSFVTGDIIRRVGERNVLLAGVACYALTLAIGLAGIEIENFWVSLALLGVGWNFLYVGGTSLLTRCYRPCERAKVQGFNDSLIFAAVALCSIVAGTLEYRWGWDMVLLVSIIPMVAILAIVLRLARRPAAVALP